ncbi:MFS transporter [Synergistales bacterium]|nr:MFS transporter [Synergistales bacterium]
MVREKQGQESAVSVFLLSVTACLIYAVSSGIRSNYGVMLNAISENSGVSYSSVSFVLALAQLVFGATQPIFGIISLKKSNRFVMCCGVLMMTVGLIAIPRCVSMWSLIVFLGVLLPAGTGAISFGIIMSALASSLSQKSVSTVSGFVNASSGIGSSAFSPLLQALIAAVGLTVTMFFMSVPVILLLPASLWLCRTRSDAGRELSAPIEKEHIENMSDIKKMFVDALKSRAYQFLMIGFFTCGFHMAIIETHLYSQFVSYGFPERTAAYAFSIFGVAGIIGAILSGAACGRSEMRRVLGFLYGSRAVITLCFFMAPKTVPVIFAFAVFLGLTGNSTVTPTFGLVNKTFGAAKVATLLGFLFLCHQCGSFISAWVGGVSASMTGTYTLIWTFDIFLCVLASAVSFSIKETVTRNVSNENFMKRS